MAKKPKRRIVVGVSVEGERVHAVKVAGNKSGHVILATRSFRLEEQAPSPATPGVEDVDPSSALADELDGGDSIDLTADSEDEELAAMGFVGDQDEDASAEAVGELLSLANLAKDRFAFTYAEPQLFMNLFDSDWDMKGRKLNRKLLRELAPMKDQYSQLKKDAVDHITLSDGRMLAFVREWQLKLLDDMYELSRATKKPVPVVSFVEAPELSLVNLVNRLYEHGEERSTVIVHVGQAHSRFIFLQEGQLYHISERIDEGADVPEIGQTIYSRLLLEMDQIDLPGAGMVILSGFSHACGVGEVLAEEMPDAQVEALDLFREGASFSAGEGMFFDPAEFGPAIGAAVRALDPHHAKRHDQVSIDLLPTKVKERQNKLMLSTPAWFLLFLIPLLAAFSLYKLNLDLERQSELALELVQTRNAAQRLAELDQEIAQAEQALASYDRSFAVIDSLMIGTQRWTTLYEKIEQAYELHGGFWLTEVKNSQGDDERMVTVSGYSVLRNRIPVLVDSLRPATLLNVEAQEIREVRVYRFELETMLSE